MDALLAQINAVPGVLGSLVCDAQGALVAQAFPPAISHARVEAVAARLADGAAALSSSVGSVGAMDFRFGNARIVVQPVGAQRLLMLCAPTMNWQFLAMSTGPLVQRLERMLAARRPPPPPESALYALVQRIEALVAGEKDRFKLRGQIALKAGFGLELIDADTPDDPVKLERLRAAAIAVLGNRL